MILINIRILSDSWRWQLFYARSNKFSVYEEKASDVALGSMIVRDALLETCDSIYIITADSDIKPAFLIINQERPKVKNKIWTPPNRYSVDLEEMKRNKIIESIDKIFINTLARFRFPDEIPAPNGMKRTIPYLWKTQSRIHYQAK